MNGVNTTDDITLYDSTLEKHDLNCKAVDQSTGELCGETETLTILNEFQRLYEARIEKADRELEGEYERLSAKLQIMEEWIRDLGEQNIMLVHTVEDLEHTASVRVKLLEEKLQQSSLIVTDSITRSGSTEEAITSLSNHVSMLETDQEHLVEKISFLKNDIEGLLKLIGRVWRDNNWYLDDISFIEIHPDEIIPAPLQCPCDKEETNDRNMLSLKLKIGQLENHKKRMIESQAKLEKTVDQLSEELIAKEELIKRLQSNDENFYEANREHTTSGYDRRDAGCEQYVPTDKIIWPNQNKVKKENVIPDTDRYINTFSKPENSIMPSNQNHGIAKCQFYNDIQFTRDIANAHQLLQTIETTIHSAQSGLEAITDTLMQKESMRIMSSTCDTLLLTSLIEKINKYKHELSNCPQELESLKHAFYSKDKLLSNLDEITKVQKDSITRMQAEIHELGEKLQEKTKIHDQTIGQYEKEKIELVKQIELQAQTIGHLQNAVVEAKKNLDHLGRKAATDVSEVWSPIPSNTYTQGSVHDI